MSKIRTEFVASWNDWQGAVCVDVYYYDRLKRRVAQLERELEESKRELAAMKSRNQVQILAADTNKGELSDRQIKRTNSCSGKRHARG